MRFDEVARHLLAVRPAPAERAQRSPGPCVAREAGGILAPLPCLAPRRLRARRAARTAHPAVRAAPRGHCAHGTTARVAEDGPRRAASGPASRAGLAAGARALSGNVLTARATNPRAS